MTIFCSVEEINQLPNELLDLFDEYSTKNIEHALHNFSTCKFQSRLEAERYGSRFSKLVLDRLSSKVCNTVVNLVIIIVLVHVLRIMSNY